MLGRCTQVFGIPSVGRNATPYDCLRLPPNEHHESLDRERERGRERGERERILRERRKGEAFGEERKGLQRNEI